MIAIAESVPRKRLKFLKSPGIVEAIAGKLQCDNLFRQKRHKSTGRTGDHCVRRNSPDEKNDREQKGSAWGYFPYLRISLGRISLGRISLGRISLGRNSAAAERVATLKQYFDDFGPWAPWIYVGSPPRASLIPPDSSTQTCISDENVDFPQQSLQRVISFVVEEV